jgi:biofilm PGA synthesis N-glycosyltransferase PgaC
MRICVVVPFLNEQDHLPVLLESIASQTRPPDELLLVDDGSGDRSSQIGADFADSHGWASLVRREAREVGRDRLEGGAAVRAFVWGLERLSGEWDVAAKLDADLRLSAATLETIERAFEGNPALGITGAFLCTEEGGVRMRHRGRATHVDGATKFYRRACLEDTGPPPVLLGWDSIDEVRAHLHGWQTGPVAVPGGDPVHLRPMSSHDGLLRGYRRRGICAWSAGEPFLHVLLVGIQRFGDRPKGWAGANYVIGWSGAALRNVPRAEREVLDEVRRDTLTRIRRRAGLVRACGGRRGW